ncbi:MAG: putative toxin-antitoxin system toxin component, PIN family [Bacteroidales bacterium]|jgi:putative PIN family toxin of toxin-antitoxin system|nr:putative toxin-antitoxin system toxin component, PIN family [Bacteroidales bacterium]
MKIILDCNIWISLLIGHQAQLVRQILTDVRFDVYACDELLEEIHDVCSREKIRTRVTDEEMDDFFRIIYAFSHMAKIEQKAQSEIRDPKDLYLLSLAESIEADSIITGDADLLDLKQHKQTQMIKLADFRKLFDN